MLFQARLAIDGLGALLDGLQGRLGEAEPALLESLSQLRLAFVSLEGAERSGRRERGQRRAEHRQPAQRLGRSRTRSVGARPARRRSA